VIEEHELQMSNFDDELGQARFAVQQQLASEHARLFREQRRAKEQLRAKHKASQKPVNNELKSIRARILEKYNANSADVDGIDLAALREAASVNDARKAAQMALHRTQAEELARAQDDESRRFEEEMEAEKQKQLSEFENTFAERKQRELLQKQQELDGQLDSEDAVSIMKEHKSHLGSLNRELDLEKDRQRQHLEAAMEKKKQAKVKKMKDQQDDKMQDELDEQRKEREMMEEESAKKKEAEVLANALNDQNRDQAKALIEKVTRARQQREKQNLLREEARQRSDRVKNAIEDAYRERDRKRIEMEAEVAAGRMKEEEVVALVEEVDVEKIKQETTAALNVENEEKMGLLKKKNQKDIRDMYKQLYPDADFDTAEWKVDDVDIVALAKQRQEKDSEEKEALQKQIEELKAREQQFVAEMEEKKKAEMEAFEKRIEEENKQLESRHTDTMKRQFEQEQAEAAKKAEVERAAKMDPEELAKLDDEARRKVAEDHKRDLEATKSSLDNERERQQKLFKAKLLARKEEAKRREAARQTKKLSEQVDDERKNRQKELDALQDKKDAAERTKQELKQSAAKRFMAAGRARARKQQRGVRTAIDAMKNVSGSAAAGGDTGGGGGGGGGGGHMRTGSTATGGSGGGGGFGMGMSMQMNPSMVAIDNVTKFMDGADAGIPFLGKLLKIENVLGHLLRVGGLGVPSDDDTPVGTYKDSKDAMLTCTGAEPVECKHFELPAKAFVLYRFGSYIMRMLAAADNTAPYSLLLAKSIPAKEHAPLWAGNAFKNSFHYDPAMRTVFLRLERCHDAGEFTLVLVHVLSHVRAFNAEGQAGDWGDTNPRFLQYFYESIQRVSSELFFTKSTAGRRLDGGGDAANNGGGPANNGGGSSIASLGLELDAMKKAFGTVTRLHQKEEVVQDFIDLTHTGTEFDTYFAADKVVDRLTQYKTFKHSSQLKSQLVELENEIAETSLSAETKAIEEKEGSGTGDAGVWTDTRHLSEVLRDQIAQLHDFADRLHGDLLVVVSQAAKVSEQVLSQQAKLRAFAEGRVKEGKKATARRSKEEIRIEAALQTSSMKLTALQRKKTVYLRRIDGIEARIKLKQSELGMSL
jgi:hypothetical protein